MPQMGVSVAEGTIIGWRKQPGDWIEADEPIAANDPLFVTEVAPCFQGVGQTRLHMGTIIRSDDTIAEFSSRGPSAIDHAAKPDVVAPAVGIESSR